ncbi:hypothetical protein O181_031780 [Austropuccinia psidii MF-1]|uniref:NADH dehydrogenase [ubiquinone] 1 alpha subcomplex subunit 6 n=1 Tax=Austropuccinia psidii MF-1 TaxID=1389203 RepID=A0A9Q3CZT5_9BASI|nr:hypothetical protein [Austropuccinia psidii MF-1]
MPKPIAVTIPSRLARLTISSPNLASAQGRARSLYRDWYRAAPEICQEPHRLKCQRISDFRNKNQLIKYPIHSFTSLRAKIRQIFNTYSHVRDVQAIDVLVSKSHMEYQEFMNLWKTPSHVMRYFEAEEKPPLPNTFMEKFLAGKDDNAVLPAAYLSVSDGDHLQDQNSFLIDEMVVLPWRCQCVYQGWLLSI